MKRMMYRSGLSGLLALVLVASLGCSAGKQDSSSASKESSTEQKTETTMPKQSQELVVKNSSGATTVSIKTTETGATLVDASGKTLATFTINATDESKKLEIKNASGQVSGYISVKGKNYTVEDASQKPLYIFKTGGDARHRFVTPDDQNVYVLKVNDGNYAVRNAEKQVISRAKGGKKESVLQNAEKQPVLQAEAMAPLALTAFGFDKLSQEQQAALAYMVNQRSAKDAKAAKKNKTDSADQGDAAAPKEKKKGKTEATPTPGAEATQSPAQ